LRPLKTGLPSKNFFATLYTEFSDRSTLAPNLTKILLAAERKGGKISIRDAQLAFSKNFRPSAQMMRSWFKDIQAILAQQTPEEKQQIWDALTAVEKSAFRNFKKISK
jgi:hypothetical protein